MQIPDIVEKVRELGPDLVVVTGGEPLLQNDTPLLISSLLDNGFTVQIETNGAFDIGVIDKRASVIMDIKCPSSGEAEKNLLSNISKLKSRDEVKFVIATKEDYEWAKTIISRYKFPEGCALLFSWASPSYINEKLQEIPPGQYRLSRRELVELIIADDLKVKFLPQLHKIIWGYEKESI